MVFKLKVFISYTKKRVHARAKNKTQNPAPAGLWLKTRPFFRYNEIMKRKFGLSNFFVALTLLILVVLGGAWSFKTLSRPQWRDLKNSSPQEIKSVQNSNPFIFWQKKDREPETFLLLGAAGAGNDAPDLTDAILIAHIDPAKQKIYLFSLPRDLLVKIPGGSNYTKLNALYSINKKNTGHEFDLIKQKAQDITGLTIDHYVFVNLNAVKDTIDILKGVNVLVQKDILDTAYPGPNHSYETFELKAGWRYLDGETALKYIRSRHSTSDFDRIARQQQILQALKQKVTTLHIWNLGTFFDLYGAISANVKTDLGILQINDYWSDLGGLPGENLIKNEITPFIISKPTYLGGVLASTLQPKTGLENYEEIKEYIKKIIEN